MHLTFENPKPNAYSLTWAQRLKRGFCIDIEKCIRCGGSVRIIASIEDPDVIQKILKHLGLEQPDWASPTIRMSICWAISPGPVPNL